MFSLFCERVSRGGTERGRERIPSRLRLSEWSRTWGSVSWKVRSWPELRSRVGCLTHWATQVPLFRNFLKLQLLSKPRVRKNFVGLSRVWNIGNSTLKHDKCFILRVWILRIPLYKLKKKYSLVFLRNSEIFSPQY